MNAQKLLTALSIGFIAFNSAIVNPVFAVDAPNFPSCTNPTGTVRVNYPSGSHGILGNNTLQNGTDTVYDLPEGNHTQCFCGVDGSATQTNFWKISSLTDSEIQQLKNLGWTFIPEGSAWGLDSGPYMAINANYSCQGGGGNNSSNSGTGGSVLGASSSDPGSVLGLATTGDSILLYGFGLLGIASLSLGLYFRKRKNN